VRIRVKKPPTVLTSYKYRYISIVYFSRTLANYIFLGTAATLLPYLDSEAHAISSQLEMETVGKDAYSPR
jgi:hypothetical protein